MTHVLPTGRMKPSLPETLSTRDEADGTPVTPVR